MKFSLIDLVIVCLLAAVLAGEISNQIRTEQRCRACEASVREVDSDIHGHLRDFGRHDWEMRQKMNTHDNWWQQMHSTVPDIWKRLDKLEQPQGGK